MRELDGKPVRLAAAASAALALAIAGCALAPHSTSAASPWPGRVMVLVAASAEAPGSPALDEALAALSGAGIADVVSESSQTVLLADFERVVTVPFLEAARRLVPGDPRRDPWLDGLARYFTVRSGDRSWHVLYAASSENAARKALERALGPGGERSWMVAERGAPRARFLWTLPAAFALVSTFSSRRRRSERLLGSLVWAPLWWAGGAPATAVALLASLAGARVSGLLPYRHSEARGPLVARALDRLGSLLGAAGGSMLAAVVILAVMEPDLIPVASLCALAQAAAFEAVAGFRSMERKREGRNSFTPVPIVSRTRRKTANAFAPLSPAIALLALLALPLSYAGGPGPGGGNAGGIPIPVPVERPSKTGSGIPLTAALALDPSVSRLPDLADAAAHAAFQRSVLYERLGDSVYGSNEPIAMQGFRRGEGGLVEPAAAALATVSDPSDATFPPGSVEALLVEAGGNAGVRLEALDGPGAPRRLALIEILVYILALVPFAASGGANLLARAVAEAASGKVREAA
ncbi:MAG: hypothetical protein JXA15_10695 [Spirochaetales bacterium]|nr:hypothetical protein [Spirochaetales bacterium]